MNENSIIPSLKPIVLKDILCAGFEGGQKEACKVSMHPQRGPQSRPGQRVFFLNTRVNSKRKVPEPCLPFKYHKLLSEHGTPASVHKQTAT